MSMKRKKQIFSMADSRKTKSMMNYHLRKLSLNLPLIKKKQETDFSTSDICIFTSLPSLSSPLIHFKSLFGQHRENQAPDS